MINQIESGRCKPSYETARRIFEKLTNFEEAQSETAEDICTWKIVKLKITNTIDDARKKMESAGISQIPIFDGKEPKGVVTEQGILSRLADSDNKSNYKKTQLGDVMEDIPGIVAHDTPVKSIVQLIRTGKFLLVSKDTKYGIISATDGLKIMDKN
jgi:predicted transcriptional regulator